MSAIGPKQTLAQCTAHVRLWGRSRHGFLREVAFLVAIGGKADIAYCSANVCSWPKADTSHIGSKWS